MKVWPGGSFLLLLLFAWLPTGLTQQLSATIDVSLQLDLVLSCLLQEGSGSTAGEVKWLDTTQNKGEEQNEGNVGSAQLVFTGVNITHTGTYTCRMRNKRHVPENRQELNKDGQTPQPTNGKRPTPHRILFPPNSPRRSTLTDSKPSMGTALHRESQKPEPVRHPRESVITVECTFRMWFENTMVHVEWHKTAHPEVGNQTDTGVLGENCTNIDPTDIGRCGCRVHITRINLSDTGNSMQGTGPNYGSGPFQTNATKETWRGLNFLLCILFGLAVGTLLYMPIIGFLLWHCRRNIQGKLTSSQMTEGNQLSMAAPGTEDLTYADLNFEKRGTKPAASSDVVYTEIKPSQQKQSGGNASAANTRVDVSPEGEGK